jgi:hypothetical protein
VTGKRARRGPGRLTAGRLVALGAIAAGAVLLVWTGIVLASRSGEARVRGVVTEVVARDIGHAESITLRAEDGRELRFVIPPEELKTPGHLREHMTYGQPLIVHYRREGETLVATRLED